MLFFIGALLAKLTDENHSNTSHVILYPSASRWHRLCPAIQIHLMLFFINRDPAVIHVLAEFKYISCYSLSV